MTVGYGIISNLTVILHFLLNSFFDYMTVTLVAGDKIGEMLYASTNFLIRRHCEWKPS